MEFEKLTAQIRTGRKKGVARQLRRDGFIPAVCYGLEKDPLALSLDPTALGDIVSGPLKHNTVMELSIEGSSDEPFLVMLQDHQYHPVSRDILHADLLRVALDREVHVRVPLELVGRSVGVHVGGVLAKVFRTLPVRCRPDGIPSLLTLDVTSLDLGDILRVKDLVLPEGVVVELDANQTLASVSAPSSSAAKSSDEAEEGEEGAEQGES